MTSAMVRQSELFVGEDWTALYRAFTEINLNAYDFNTIRQAMFDYVRRNYPEDYNDWVDSSEFVAIMDLLAYSGAQLAFRMDLDSRENFLDLAVRRDSVLRLSRFLGYNAKRAYPAKGLVKLTEITTTEDVYDSLGTSLNGVTIQWDDPNNPDWLEQWTIVLNSVLISTNPFGTPLKVATINGRRTQLYRLNNRPVSAGNYGFTSNINNNNVAFEVVNADFSTTYGFFERMPDPNAPFHIVYQNDGNGNASPGTGFFMLFKEGTLYKNDYSVDEPLENRIIDIDMLNVNETDVWVQTVNDAGAVLTNGEWTKVGLVPSDNITKYLVGIDNISYNTVDPAVRKIFQVVTKENDQISIRFGDGRFGEIPSGNIRVWTRTGTGAAFTLKPDDIQDVTITVPYYTKKDLTKDFRIGFSLQESVGNATSTESNDDIRRRAPQAFQAQGRMVSGEDYNALPNTNNLAIKAKSVNRIYSGQSRYLDLNDPTGTYQSTNIFLSDGAIYREDDDQYAEIPHADNRTSQDIISTELTQIIGSIALRDFIYDEWLNGTSAAYNFNYNSSFLWWDSSKNYLYPNTGRFSKDPTGPANWTDADWESHKVSTGVNATPGTPEEYIIPQAMIFAQKAGWVSVATVKSTGDSFYPSGEGMIRLSNKVERGDKISKVLPAFRRQINAIDNQLFLDAINARQSFGLGYDHLTQEWYVIPASKLTAGTYSYDTRNQTQDRSWFIRMDYTSLNWRITARGLTYVAESAQETKFFFTNEYRSIDPSTGKAGNDSIDVLGINANPKLGLATIWIPEHEYHVGDIIVIQSMDAFSNITNMYYGCIRDHVSDVSFNIGEMVGMNFYLNWMPMQSDIGHDQRWDIVATYRYTDGYVEPHRIKISFSDLNGDGLPDNPEAFSKIVSPKSWVFHKRIKDIYGYEYYKLDTSLKYWSQQEQSANDFVVPVLNPNEVVFIYDETDDTNHQFWQCLLTEAGQPDLNNPTEFAALSDQTAYSSDKGRISLNMQWRHIAALNQRIDPAISNIIDTFVLTRDYYNNMVTWKRSGLKANAIPTPPTINQLEMTFADMENIKMFSDEIIWRPAKFRLLFGEGADQELKAKFKIVKLPNAPLSDGEIKSRVVQLIDFYFDVNSWDFGETFYYTGLSTFLQQQMATSIGSVVIVPITSDQSFGNLFEIRSNPDELFFPTTRTNDVEIISANTQTNLRIK